jgi:hypothetical protein
MLDVAVQMVAAGDVTNAVTSNAGNPPGTASAATWSSTGLYLQTRLGAFGAGLLMVTLSNAAPMAIWSFDVGYDLTVPVTPFGEEVPGHRIYYSDSGVPNSWVLITNISTAGTHTSTPGFPGHWQPGSVMYLLFADDNATTNPDGAYQIDNFRVTNVVHGDPTCVAITNHPQNLMAAERARVTFSIMATGLPQHIQWYRSDDGGLNYTPLVEARSNSYTIASAEYPEDNGARFQATVSNSLCVVTSSVAMLTVHPDTNPPVVVRARGELSPDTVVLTFAEAINPMSVSPDNFILFETGTDPAVSLYLTFDAILANGTNITLVTDARDPGKNHSVRILHLEDASLQANVITPTNVPLRQAIQLIGFDTGNEWKYDINSGDRFGTGWEMIGYDDSTWPSGLAGLGFDSSVNAVPIRTQLPYQANSVPVYFRRHFSLPGTNGVVLTLRDVVDDGAVYFINGQEVFRHNVASGPLTFATRSTTGAPDPTPIMGPYTLPATNLLPGDNVMAVAVFQSGAASGDVEMAVELSAEIGPICFCAIRILEQPRSQNPIEGGSFSLTVVVEGAVPLFYQWRKNGTNILGATNATLYFPSAALSDAGSYDVVASNSFSSVTSLVANIVMGDEPLPPPFFLSAVGSTNLTNITLTFSEVLDMASAQAESNYDVQLFIGGGAPTIFSAVLTNGTNVILTTSPRSRSCGSYRVTVTNLTDRTVARQPVTPNMRVLHEEMVILAPDFVHEWHYDQSGVDRSGTGWQAMNYDDTQASWQRGLAGFSSGTAGEEIAPAGFEFRTYSLVRATEGGPVTTYFRTHFFWPSISNGALLKWAGVIDDGAVFYVNGVEAGRIRMTNNPIAFTNTAIAPSPENANVHLAEGPFVLNATNLNAFGDNVLAIEVHQFATNSSDAALSIQLIAEIPFVILPSAPRVEISRNGTTGEITIQWSGCGTLQQTAGEPDHDVFQSWIDVPGNPNPYRFIPIDTGRFFRVRP